MGWHLNEEEGRDKTSKDQDEDEKEKSSPSIRQTRVLVSHFLPVTTAPSPGIYIFKKGHHHRRHEKVYKCMYVCMYACVCPLPSI